MTVQFTATGTYSDLSTADITSLVSWSTSDATIATIGAATGLASYTNAGRIWGGDVGITASLAPGTPGTASLLVISSDSGSMTPLMPQQANHWTALGLSPWGSWFGLQELTGNCVGSGSAGFTLTANAGAGQGVVYGQAPQGAGWLRTFVSFSGTSNTRISAAAATGPNPSATSVAFLAYGVFGPSTAGAAYFGAITNSSLNRFYIDTPNASSSMLRIITNTGAKTLVGPTSMNHGDRVHPVLFIYNKTTGELWAASDVSVVMTGGMGSVSDDVKGIGSILSTTASSASFGWFATATGSIVEALCSVSASADFLSRLGWTVSWKNCPTDSGSIKAPFLVDHWKGLGLVPWTATWNCQEEIGPLESYDRWDTRDIIGWRLSNNAIDAYRYAVPNWTRKGIKLTQTSDHRAQRSTSYGPPPLFDPTGSFAFLAYVLPSGSSTVVAGTQLVGIAGSSVTVPNAAWGGLTFTGGVSKMVTVCAGASATGTVTVPYGDRVHPWLFVYDSTNSRVKFYSDLDVLTGSFNALSIVTSVTASVGFGGISTVLRTPCSGVYVYAAFTTGSQAELLSDNGRASAFLKTMGWNPSW